MEKIERKWWKEASVYQIYPRSFMDSNGDGIGDLRGIIDKLDYLKDLGVDVVWISPFYDSPLDDNGYDISNYKAIHKDLGTMEDMEELIRGLHKRDMKLLIDLVVNHTSDEHPWFIESKKGKDNPYSDYYIWKDRKNNWESVFSGSAWEYCKERNQYYLHVFSKKQADLNWENKKVREEVYDIMNFWIGKGCDGFRMDVINLISKRFRDDNYKGEEYFFNGPRVHEYLKEMHERVLKGRNLMTVGECPGANIEDGLKFSGFNEGELNMIFTFQHMDVDSKNGKWDFKDFSLVELKKILSSWQEGLHGKAWNSLYLNNHDQPRMVSRFGNDSKYWKESAKMLAHVIHTMEGTPYIYQGEELGMTNLKMDIPGDLRDVESINAYNDLISRGVFTKDHMDEAIARKARDNARTPIQWDDSENAGFTKGSPWMKVNPNYKLINAKAEKEDGDSILNFYKKLLKARKEIPTLIYGKFKEYFKDDKNLYVFERKLADTKVISINSFSSKDLGFNIGEFLYEIGEDTSKYEILHTNMKREGFKDIYELKPYECLSLVKLNED